MIRSTRRTAGRRRPASPSLPRSLAGAFPLLVALLACGESADSIVAIRQQQASGDIVGTIEPLRELLKERPDDPEANYLYGRALVASGQLTLATWPLRQAMEDPEWRPAAGIQLAQAALGTADFNVAVEVTTRLLEDDPDYTPALLYRAQAQAHWKKDEEAALADAERVLELEPDVIEAYEPLILALLALDRHDEASRRLAEAGERLEESDAPESSLAWHCSTTAIFALEGGDPEGARAKWNECLEKYPTDPTVVTNALEFHDGHGEWQRSVEVLRAALEEAPEQRFFRTSLAARLRATGSPAEGEALLREATEAEDPRVAATAWLDVAQYRHAMLEHAAAADAIARAIEEIRQVEEPGPQILFQYADALVVSGQLDEALAVAEDIDVPAQQNMIRGRVAQERGDPARALAFFDEALLVWPDNPWARYYAALAAEKVGDFERALEEYRYSIRVSPGATDARTRAAKLLIAENKIQRAYQLLFLERDKAPLEPEGETVAMYLMARAVNPKQLREELVALGRRNPPLLPQALARGAEGAADAAGPAAALHLLRDSRGFDYTHPWAAPALRALVRYSHEAGEPERAAQAVDAALAAHPGFGPFHAIRGLHLELGGATGDARQAYARALELAPEDAVALAGLGRLAESPAEATALFDRAAAADPSDPEPKLAAARAVLASGQEEAARQRLRALLEAHPLEPEPAAELASLDLAGGAVSEQTLRWALRAARFESSVEAFERLSAVYEQLGQADQAVRMAERARELRENRASRDVTSEG